MQLMHRVLSGLMFGVRAGLMRILLPMILDKATELGLPEVWLWTLDGTAPFYEKYGWVRQESTIYQDEPIAIMRALLPRASSTA